DGPARWVALGWDDPAAAELRALMDAEIHPRYGFGVRPRPPHPSVRAVAIGGEITDTGGHAWRAYAATDGECVLVRPDGHIAIRTHDQAAIDAYLRPALPQAP
ncbi:hypothetical protein ACWEWX_41810, partial [Streptomyces asiaticus]